MNASLRPLFFALLITTPGLASAQVNGGHASAPQGCTWKQLLVKAQMEAKTPPKMSLEEFRRKLPEVTVVLPGEPRTNEVRNGCSRFIVTNIDENGYIRGAFR